MFLYGNIGINVEFEDLFLRFFEIIIMVEEVPIISFLNFRRISDGNTRS